MTLVTVPKDVWTTIITATSDTIIENLGHSEVFISTETPDLTGFSTNKLTLALVRPGETARVYSVGKNVDINYVQLINVGDFGFGVGTVSAPSVFCETDTNTGLNFLGSDQLQLVTGGVQRLLMSTTAATLNLPLGGTAVTQSATDTTSGRLTKVGDFGLGASVMTVLSNLDDFDLKPGWYAATTSTTGTLPTHSGGTSASPFASVLVMRYGTNNTVQIYAPVGNGSGGGRVFYRVGNTIGPTWLPWREVFSNLNILGTVSQSAGVPTGAVIEKGSNANGEYVRFADGTQICRHTVTVSLAIATAFVGGFRSAGQTWTYPAAFVAASTPGVAVTPLNITALSGLTTNVPGTVSVNWSVGAVTSQAAADRTVSLIATGRWF